MEEGAGKSIDLDRSIEMTSKRDQTRRVTWITCARHRREARAAMMRIRLEMWPNDDIRYRTIERREVAGEEEMRRGECLQEAVHRRGRGVASSVISRRLLLNKEKRVIIDHIARRSTQLR